MHKRSVIAIALAAVVVLGAACGGDSDEPEVTSEEGGESAASYSDNDVTFDYPSDWEEFPEAEATATSTGSNELWSATVGPDKTNLVNVTAYKLNIDVTEENVDSIEGELDQVIQGVVDQAGGEITSGPTAEDVAGFPAYTYTWEGVEVDGEPKDSSAYFVFVDDIEYFFNCQYSDDTEEDIQAGCDQILETFEVSEAS